MTSSIDGYFYGSFGFRSDAPVRGFQIDQQKVNYTLGVSVLRNMNPNLSIGIGLQYSDRDFAGVCCDTCNKLAIIYRDISIDFIEVPLFMLYTFGRKSKKLRPYLKAGLITSTVLNVALINTYRKVHFSALTGIGLSYKINESFILNLESYYENMMHTIADNSDYRFKNVSIQLGLQTNF